MKHARHGRAMRRMRGFTLVELVVSIVVFAIAVFGVAGIVTAHATQDVDRMIRQQATAIASSYLEEILQEPYSGAGNTVEGARNLYNDVRDYNSLVNVGARDRNDNAIPGLSDYTVSVAVGAGSLGLPLLPAGQVEQVIVTVRHVPSNRTVVMSGYRTVHP